MNIIFDAKEVSYDEAIDGDIVQVSFAQDDHDDILENPYKYLFISVNYEFPPFEPTFEWYDGKKYGGSDLIIDYTFQVDHLMMQLDNNLVFDISFKIGKPLFEKINQFFRNIHKT
ncbi:MAG: hypothetical protein AB1724_02740 [Thermodesulfobacteriota bacterium]